MVLSLKGVGQVNIKWCHCLLSTRWGIYFTRYAFDLITQNITPEPTHSFVSRSPSHTYTDTFIELQSQCFADTDKIALLSKMETPQNFSSKCTNTKA